MWRTHYRLEGYEAGEYWWHPATAVFLHNPTEESPGVSLGITASPPADPLPPWNVRQGQFPPEPVLAVLAGYEGIYWQFVDDNAAVLPEANMCGAERSEMWVVDIEHMKMVIYLAACSDVTDAELAEGHAIVNSIRIEPWENEPGFRMIFKIPNGWDSA
jgi:hypothetical protein